MSPGDQKKTAVIQTPLKKKKKALVKTGVKKFQS